MSINGYPLYQNYNKIAGSSKMFCNKIAVNNDFTLSLTSMLNSDKSFLFSL